MARFLKILLFLAFVFNSDTALGATTTSNERNSEIIDLKNFIKIGPKIVFKKTFSPGDKFNLTISSKSNDEILISIFSSALSFEINPLEFNGISKQDVVIEIKAIESLLRLKDNFNMKKRGIYKIPLTFYIFNKQTNESGVITKTFKIKIKEALPNLVALKQESQSQYPLRQPIKIIDFQDFFKSKDLNIESIDDLKIFNKNTIILDTINPSGSVNGQGVALYYNLDTKETVELTPRSPEDRILFTGFLQDKVLFANENNAYLLNIENNEYFDVPRVDIFDSKNDKVLCRLNENANFIVYDFQKNKLYEIDPLEKLHGFLGHAALNEEGSKVIWTNITFASEESVFYDAYSYDLISNKTEKLFEPEIIDGTDFNISNNLFVTTETGDTDDGVFFDHNIAIYDLNTNQKLISINPDGASVGSTAPSISNRKILYEGGLRSTGKFIRDLELFLYDIDTKLTERLTFVTPQESIINSDIKDGLIIWSESNSNDLYIYYLE